MIFLSLVESSDLGVVGWVLGNKAEDEFGCRGWWVLVLVESPDLVVLGWVLGNKGEDGFEGEQSRGRRLGSRMGCKEGRMGMLCNGMGCKESILGILGVYLVMGCVEIVKGCI